MKINILPIFFVYEDVTKGDPMNFITFIHDMYIDIKVYYFFQKNTWIKMFQYEFKFKIEYSNASELNNLKF